MKKQFTLRFFNSTTQGRVTNKLSALSIESFRKDDYPDHNKQLKALITEMDRLCATVLEDDRLDKAQIGYLQTAILGTQ